MEAVWTAEILKRQASNGFWQLILRKIFFQLIGTFSTIILARVLFPKAFGDFAILVFLIEFLAFLPSQGLSGAIIQKKSKLSDREASTIFWGINLASILIVLLIFIFAPVIAAFYKDISDGAFLIRLISVAVLAINIRSVPCAILERQFKYSRLAAIEILEIFLTQTVSIILAFSGFGVFSLFAGYLTGKIFAAFAFFVSVNNFLSLKFSFSKIKQFLPFALNFQIYHLTYSISGSVAPVYIGAVLGSTYVGYLTWAGGVGLIPWSMSELIGRVALPVFSRVQKDKRLFARVLERAFDFLAMVTFPLCTLIFVFAPELTEIVYSRQWLPAVGALRLFVVLGALQSSIFLCTTALLGMGYVKYVRNITLFSGAAFWIFALILIPKLGFWAQPLAWILSTAFLIPTIFKVKKVIKVSYWRSLFVYLLLSMTAVIPVYFLVTVTGLFSLFLVVSLSLLIYLGLLFIFRRENLRFVWNQWVSVFDSTRAFQFVIKMLR